MRRWIGLVGVLVSVMLVGGPTRAEGAVAEPPVAFVDADPVVTSCAELAGAGVRIRIRNETALPQKVCSEIELVRRNGRTGRPKSICGGLKLVPGKRTLAPGKGAALTLMGSNAVRKGSFSGSIAIYGGRGRVSRTDLTISSEAASTGAELAAIPLVSSLEFALDSNEKGPFWIPVEGSNEDLPAADKDDAGGLPLTLGALTGPDGPVAVIYEGKSRQLPPGAAQAGLELEEYLAPGTYKGNVDLAPDDPDNGDVSLEIKVSSQWWKAFLSLLVGIFLGVLLLRISGRTLPRARLLGRIGGLQRRYEEARMSLTESSGGYGGWRTLKVTDLPRLMKGLEAKVENATSRLGVLVQIEKTVVESLEAAIAEVEGQIDLLQELPGRAQRLEAALLLQQAALLPPFRDPQKAQGKPRLDVAAETLLGDGEIGLHELKPRLDEIDSRARQICTLRGLELRLEAHWKAVLWLQDPLHQGADPQNLAAVRRQLETCRQDLWGAVDDEALKKEDDHLEEAAKTLVRLESEAESPRQGGKLCRTRARRVRHREPSPPLLGPPQAAISGAYGVIAPQPPTAPSPAAPAASSTAERPRLTDREASRAVRRALIIQFFVVIGAASLALVSGFEFLYMDKPWGTWWDVVAAVVWGITAQAAATSLVSSLDSLGSLTALWRRS